MRSEFSAPTKRTAYDRAGGRCEGCGAGLRDAEAHYHHILEARLGGDNSLANCWVVCIPCHKIITRETSQPRITKMKHMRDGSINAHGPKVKIASRPKVRSMSDKIGIPPRRDQRSCPRFGK